MGLKDLAEEVYRLRQSKDEMESNLKDVNKKLMSAENELLEGLGHEGLSKIEVEGKGTFGMHTRHFYSVEDKENLKTFLEEQGATDLLSVNHNTLNAYAKELKERFGEDFDIPGVKETSKTTIRIQKSRS